MKLTDISRQLATALATVGVSGLVLVGCNNSSAPEASKEPSLKVLLNQRRQKRQRATISILNIARL
jgi:hypothetical protein